MKELEFRHPGQVRAQLEREPESSARLAEGAKNKEPAAVFSWIPDRRSRHGGAVLRTDARDVRDDEQTWLG